MARGITHAYGDERVGGKAVGEKRGRGASEEERSEAARHTCPLASYRSGKMPVSVRSSAPTMSTGLSTLCCRRMWWYMREMRCTRMRLVSASVQNMKT